MISNVSPLHASELFEDLMEEEVSRVSPFCSTFAVIENGLLFAEGREASHLYVVTEGQISLQKAIRGPHGRRLRRTTITMCRPGELVGWSGLVPPHKYTLSAVAWETTRLIRIDAKMLRRALEMYPEMGYKVTKALAVVMSRRLRQMTDVLVSERSTAAFAEALPAI